MAKKTITVGSGITEHKKVISTEDDVFDHARPQATRPGDIIDDAVGRAVKWAVRVLHKAGIKRKTAMPDDDYTTREGYAKRIIHHYQWMRAEIERNDAFGTAHSAIQLSANVCEAHMKFRWERAALSGLTAKSNLDDGRVDGVKARQKTADAKKAILKKSIEDLFESGQGWKMKNEEIADFLIERKLSTYTKSSTLAHVKAIAAACRKVGR